MELSERQLKEPWYATSFKPSLFIPTAYLIDAMALIQMSKSAGTATFGELFEKYSDIVISTLSNCCTQLDLVFYWYRPVSIKPHERNKRGESNSVEVKIHGGSTPAPKQWTKYCQPEKQRKLGRVSLWCLKSTPTWTFRPLRSSLLAD